jgi:transcriptional regulator with XRE-family HTH domain
MTIQGVASLEQMRKALALAIKERRQSLGSTVTQEDVAVKAQISVRHFQKLESGSANPRPDTLLAIAKALQTSAHFRFKKSNAT